MVTYPKYQRGSEIGDNNLDTAVGVQRNPYLGYFCGDQNMGRGKLADQLLPTQTYYSKIQDWTLPKLEQPSWIGVCGRSL